MGSVLALAGCSTTPSTADALAESDEVHNAVNTLMDAVAALNESLAEFGKANWTDVVPHVRAAADEVKQGVTSLRAALGYPD